MPVHEFVKRTTPANKALDAVLNLEPARARKLITTGFAVGVLMLVVEVAVGGTSVNTVLTYLALATVPSTIISAFTRSLVVWAFMFPFYAIAVFGASIGLLVASVPLGSAALTAVVSLLVLATGIPAFIFLFYIITSRNVGGRGSVGGRRGSR
mgnify:CR=1 FL=1|jgi:hypothetical protein